MILKGAPMHVRGHIWKRALSCSPLADQRSPHSFDQPLLILPVTHTQIEKHLLTQSQLPEGGSKVRWYLRASTTKIPCVPQSLRIQVQCKYYCPIPASIMTARQPLLCLMNPRKIAATSIAAFKRAFFTTPTRKYYHSSPPWQQDVSAQPAQKKASNPINESMTASSSPTGSSGGAAVQEDENRNAAFLGEADSDDCIEADVESHPEAHRHELDNVAANALHGQSSRLNAAMSLPRLQHAVRLTRPSHRRRRRASRPPAPPIRVPRQLSLRLPRRSRQQRRTRS